MMIWVWILGGYLAIGLATSVAVSYSVWKQGEDFTVSELLPFFVRIPTWPIGAWLWLSMRMEKPIGEVVLIPGSKSAKVLRTLSED